MKNPTLPVPVVEKKAQINDRHGDLRTDDYFWLREKENPQVLQHLNDENAYTESYLSQHQDLMDRLFIEMKGRIAEDDAGVPVKRGEYDYYSRVQAGSEYALHCRRRRTPNAAEEIILDENRLAEGHDYLSVSAVALSPDQTWLAYSLDTDGSERHQIHFKDLQTGEHSVDMISGAATSLEWAESKERVVFYTKLDEHDRPDRVFRHVVGEPAETDVEIYKERDPQIYVSISKSRSRDYLFLECHGKVTSEVSYLAAKDPFGTFKVIEPRRRGVEYSADHQGDRFLIVTNDTERNFRLVETPVNDPGAANWKELRKGSDTLLIEAIDPFRNYVVVHERENGLPQLRVLDLKADSEHVIEFTEPTYQIGGQPNAEYESETYRFSYTSMITPQTVFDYDLKSRERKIRKTQKIPSGYDPSLYHSEYIFAKAQDGARIPISIVYRKDSFRKNGTMPLYLYGYGSYGMSMPVSFSTVRLSLLDRGFVYAIAHVRGGSEMGRAWYESAKFLTKKTTFLDFVAAARHLARESYTREGEITISGGSAGGMLVGASLNMAPDLFKAAVADVPFVDVLNTMLDKTLPLTPIEFEEWGNPEDPDYYHYIKSYSPYDNVERRGYPHLLVTSGLNDPRVTYWEPAKWVAKLREFKTDKNLLIQYIHMGAGHGGPSGRYESLKEYAREYAFVLDVYEKA